MAQDHNTTHDFAAHNASYAGFMSGLKYGTVAVVVIVALVVLAIS